MCWDWIAGKLRDLKHYLSTETAWNIYSIVFAYNLMGLVICSIILFLADNRGAYCNWTPERGISSAYWAIEYVPKKAACLLWLTKEERMPPVEQEEIIRQRLERVRALDAELRELGTKEAKCPK